MNKTVSAIGGLFVILVAVVFIVQFRPGSGASAAPGQGPTCAIEMQGSCIPTSHYWAAYRLAGGGFDQSYLKSMGLRRIVADGLIERFLLNEDAKRLGITVSDDELSAELARGRAYVSLPADKERELGYYLGLLAPQPRRLVWEVPFRAIPVKSSKTNAFDLKTYEKNVRTYSKLSPTEFREFMHEELVAARMRDLIRSRVHVAEAEGYDDYARRKSTVTLDYAKLDRQFYADLFVDQSQKLVDEWAEKNADEINKTYESRKSQFEGECRVSSHILAKVREDASDEDKAKAKRRIDKALADLKDGWDFGDVARRLSEDTSANRGGELGCVPRKQTVEPFEKALFALEEGKTSDVVTTEFGLHIIHLDKIAKGDAMEKVVKAQIARELYLKHKADEKAAEAAKAIQAAVKGGKTLEDAVKTHLAEIASQAIPPPAPKRVPGGVAGGVAPGAAPSKDDKKDEKPAADEVVENKVYTVDTHPDRPLVQATAPFNMSGNPLPEAASTTDLVKQAFALKNPGDTTSDVVALNDGYAIVQLKEKTPVKKEEWEKDREETLDAIRKVKQAEALVAYVARLRAKMESAGPIKRNESIVNEPPDEKGDKGDEPVTPEDGEP